MRLAGCAGASGGQAARPRSRTRSVRDHARVDQPHRGYALRASARVMGPHPFPTIVRDFQAVISREIRAQVLEREGRLPDAVLACVGGGSNAIGAFYHFIEDKGVRLIGCEAAGRGVDTAETAATIATGRLGIFHGMKSLFLPRRVRPDRSGVFDFRRAGLPRHRAGACLPARHRPRGIRRRHGRRGGGSVRVPVPNRGHYTGDRVRARGRACDEARAARWAKTRSLSSTFQAAAIRTAPRSRVIGGEDIHE